MGKKVISMICEKCEREEMKMFDTVVRIDYVEHVNGKSHKYRVYINC